MTDLLGPAQTATSGALLLGVTTRPADYRVIGAPDTWFADCSSPTAEDGTEASGPWFNAVLGALRTLMRGNGLQADGITPVLADSADDTMLFNALLHLIQRGRMNAALDTGTPNALKITLSPVPPELPDGFSVYVKALTTTTALATLTLNSATYPVMLRGGTVTAGGEIIGGDWHLFTFNRSRNAFQIVGPQTATVVQNITNQVTTGGSGGTAYVPTLKIFTASGTYVPSPGASMAIVAGTAAGGSGATSGATNGPYGPYIGRGLGGGGGAGGWFRFRLPLTGVASVPIVMGSGGAAPPAGTGATGNAGGSLAFGAYASAAGGFGGKNAGTYYNDVSYGAGGLGGTAVLISGLVGIAANGQPGTQATTYDAGNGGTSPFGGGGYGGDDLGGHTSGGVGGYGAGGGGADWGGNAGEGAGAAGNGGGGYLEIWEF